MAVRVDAALKYLADCEQHKDCKARINGTCDAKIDPDKLREAIINEKCFAESPLELLETLVRFYNLLIAHGDEGEEDEDGYIFDEKAPAVIIFGRPISQSSVDYLASYIAEREAKSNS